MQIFSSLADRFRSASTNAVFGGNLTAGAAAKADYSYGKAVFIMADRGLMVDASLGGQKFMYTPKLLVEGTQRKLSMNK